MNGLKALLTITLLNGFAPMAFASDIETSCNDSTMGAFSLNIDAAGKITSGSIGLIYKDYRKCDLTKENTRIVTEFGESILKSDCVGSAKLLYDHVKKILYAVEPDQDRKIAISSCTSFSQDTDPIRLIFELRASVREQLEQTTYPELEKKASVQLLQNAKDYCQAAGQSGHVRSMSALQTSSGPAGHSDRFGRGSAESIFMCD